MKTVWKVILIINASLVGLFVILTVSLFFLITANSARNPDQVARKADLKLPAYRITRSEDNMDRTSSAWSYYAFEIEFEKPLSESYLRRVAKKRTCTREGTVYKVEDENPDEWHCLIYLYPAENRATLEYTFWDYLF